MPTFAVTQKGRLALLALLCSIGCFLFAAAPQRAAATESTGPSTRVINGTQVANDPAQWPYIVALVTASNFQFCGGTLIDPSWVLTAAHCEDVPAIIIGRKKMSTTGGQRILVDSQIFHPNWDGGTMQNDIQLLHLAQPVTNPSPIGLIDAVNDPAVGDQVSIAGWGVTEFSNGNTVDDLREAQVNVFSNASCDGLYGGIVSSMLCAAYFDPIDPNNGPNRDTCQGDSGGPLVAQTPGGPRLAGITSFGNDCALYPYPGVYTRVSSFKSWVMSQIGEKATFNVTKLSYGSREIGSSNPLTVTVKSSGLLPIGITGSLVTGSSDYSLVSDNCSGTGSMNPGATCEIVVNYTPSATGLAQGSLKISTDSANSPFEVLGINGYGQVPTVPKVLLNTNVFIAQSGKAKRLPRGKIKVVVKGYFPIPSGSKGSDVCLNKGTLTGAVSGKQIVAHADLGWFGTRCVATFSLRLPAKTRRKKVAFDFHMSGNNSMAAADAHSDVKIK